MTAARAGFGGIGRVYQYDLSSSVRSFGDKSVAQIAPTLIQDAFAEVWVTNQVDDLQIFECDQIVVSCVGMGHFVEQVLALISDVFMQTLDPQQRLAAILTALHGTLQSALSQTQLALGSPIMFRRFNALSSVVGEQVLDVQIDAYLLSGWRECDRIGQFAAKANVPFARCASNTRRLDGSLNRTMPAHSHATHSGDFQPPTIQPEAIAVYFEAKTVEVLIPLEAWITRCFSRFDTAEECLERFIAIGSCHLQNVAVNVLEHAKGCFVALHQPKLFVQTDTAPLKFPSVLSLRHTHIVPVASRIQAQRQALVLSGRGI